jgi:hypothetical protein
LAPTLTSPCLGHEPKVRVATTKVVTILEMPNPIDVHILNSFIELCNYYMIYVPEFNIIVHFFNALLKKYVVWTWSE